MQPTDEQRVALSEAAEAVTAATAALKDAKNTRDDLIRQASADGLSHRTISSLAAVSYQRIAQITGEDQRLPLDATREAYCPECGAMPGERCVGSRGYYHGERYSRRRAIHDGELDDVMEGEPTYGPAYGPA